MTVAFVDGLLYAVLPAAVGALAAVIQIVPPARRFREDPTARARVYLLVALPMTVVVLAVAGALQAANAPRDMRLQLMVLGGAAFLQAGLQGALARRSLRAILHDRAPLPRALVPVFLAEVIVIPPFVWVALLAGAPAV